MNTLQEILAVLSSSKRALFCTHISPDPDAIGSVGGLAHLFCELGGEAVVYLPEALPTRFAPLTEGLRVTSSIPAELFDAVVAVDTASLPRLGPEHQALAGLAPQFLNIDHHTSNTCYGMLQYIDGTAPASAVLVLRLYKEAGIAPSPRAASLLYAGLLDDTGSFRYSNTTPEAFLAASDLIAAGASAEAVANILYFSVPERVLRLKARAVEELRMVLDGQVAFIAVSAEMLASCAALPEDTEGIVDIARSVEGVRAAAFMREMDRGWKVSLRAKDEGIDVNAVAAKFGGGGHRAAAGCRIDGTLAEVQAQVESALAAAFADA